MLGALGRVTDQEPLTFAVNVLDAQAASLGRAQTGAVTERGDGVMHGRAERGKQPPHFVLAEHDREAPRGLAKCTDRAHPCCRSVLAKKKRSPAAYTFRVDAW